MTTLAGSFDKRMAPDKPASMISRISSARGRSESCPSVWRSLLLTSVGMIAHERESLRTGFRTQFFANDLGFGVRLIVDLDQFFHRDVCIDLRGRETRVAQQFLDVAQVGAAIKQMRRE